MIFVRDESVCEVRSEKEIRAKNKHVTTRPIKKFDFLYVCFFLGPRFRPPSASASPLVRGVRRAGSRWARRGRREVLQVPEGVRAEVVVTHLQGRRNDKMSRVCSTLCKVNGQQRKTLSPENLKQCPLCESILLRERSAIICTEACIDYQLTSRDVNAHPLSSNAAPSQ